MDLVELADARSQAPDDIPAEVSRLFETIALKLACGDKSKGVLPRERFSADAILHHIRWYYQVEKNDRAFKCNNNWTAPLARWFLARHPEHPKFFELRERVDDGYTPDDVPAFAHGKTSSESAGC